MCTILDIINMGDIMQRKVVLVDGNNLLFRSYYATAYTGTILRNSKGLPTNALYGFSSMINKIINEEKPDYMVVAFDIGRNFRKKEYDFYKEGRQDTPDELKVQMPIARELLDAMGISHMELEPYEADDIIGTISKKSSLNDEYYSLIVSSDKDLLQLIDDETEVKLLKQTGFIRYNKESFMNDYGVSPIKIIDLKALMGDSSDNIPGVKGIGEKTALKLLQEYGSLDNIYNNIDSIKGKLKEKLENDKENAYISYKLATIYRDVPLDVDFESFKYKGSDVIKLREMYEELEFYSLIKNINVKEDESKSCDYVLVKNIDEILVSSSDEVAYYLEMDDYNYHLGNMLKLGIATKDKTYIVDSDLISSAMDKIKDNKLYTYDLKKSLVKIGMDIESKDLMVASYILNYNSLEDISTLMNEFGLDIPKYENIKKNKFENINELVSKKVRFIYDNSKKIFDKLNEDEKNLYENVEHPLIYVLASMEVAGFKFDASKNTTLKEEINKRVDILKEEIYELAGCTFNIASPKQLGDVLFEKLKIGVSKKNDYGYKTDVKTLKKYAVDYPIVDKVLEYRNITKILNTYLESLEEYAKYDGKIHTIFNQTLTRTGRLSSSEPNLQNIPVKEELGKKVRIAFVPSNDILISADYSQIELRILAHISNCKELIEAFRSDEDIHTKVASDIYGVSDKEVTKKMRSTAKAVIFGIVYGISGFGLGENLNISQKEAKEFINKYYEFYPGVKEYMENIKEYAYKNGYVTTMFGRVRNIGELKDSNFHVRTMGERMALNTPIQGTSADIMKMAMINVYNRFISEGIKSKVILQVHDEIIIDAFKDEEEKIEKILKEEMEGVVKLSVPLKVEVNTGINWYSVK